MRTIHHMLLLLLSAMVFNAHAQSSLCERKVEELKWQMENARQYGNVYRLRGLNRALARVQSRCNDEGVLGSKRKQVEEQQKEVDELMEEIREYRAEGRSDKVKKREAKLQRELETLVDLQHELKALESMRGEAGATSSPSANTLSLRR